MSDERQLGWFFAITFALAWLVPALLMLIARSPAVGEVDLSLYSPVYYLGVWSPAIAAIAVSAMAGGVAGLRTFLSRVTNWRCRPRLYAIAFVLIPALYLGAAVVWQLWGFDALGLPREIVPYLATALLTATAGPVEEIGWRGFALPRLHRRMGGVTASCVLAAIWGLWHLPIFLVDGFAPEEFALFLVQILAVSMIFSIFFNASAGCVPLAMFMHWLTNFPYPWEGTADLSVPQTVMLSLCALALLLGPARRYLEDQNLVKE